MKAILEFDMEESFEKSDFYIKLQATGMALVINDLENWLRNVANAGDYWSKKDIAFAEAMLDKIRSLKDQYNVDMSHLR